MTDEPVREAGVMNADVSFTPHAYSVYANDALYVALVKERDDLRATVARLSDGWREEIRVKNELRAYSRGLEETIGEWQEIHGTSGATNDVHFACRAEVTRLLELIHRTHNLWGEIPMETCDARICVKARNASA